MNSKSIETGHDIRVVLLAAVFVTFPVTLYLPGAIYLGNTSEYTVGLGHLAAILTAALALSVAIGTCLLVLVPRAFRHRLVAIAFAVGLMFWIQGSMLTWHYGVFDGREIAWDEHSWKGLIDGTLWVALLAVSLFIPLQFIKVGRLLAVVIISAQTLYLGYLAVVDLTRPPDPSARYYAIDSADKYRFNNELNVILIVLDAFQTDVLSEILRDEPEYAATFEGFTYFRDAIAGGNYTELAIPSLLTGEVYDNSLKRDDFMRTAYLDNSVMSGLKQNGYDVEIYPWMGWGNESILFDPAIASNIISVEQSGVEQPLLSEKNAKEAVQLIDLSIFRVVPHNLKKYVYNEQRWLLAYIAAFLVPEEFKGIVNLDDKFSIGALTSSAPDQLPPDMPAPVFKYYHLSGVHSPLSVNEQLEFSPDPMPFSRINYLRQAKANLRYLDVFFDKLRDAGLYDKTLIVVVGDHGSGETPEMYIELPGASREPTRLEGTLRNFRRDKARALAVALVKPLASTGPVEISDAPVSLTSVPSTIFSELDIDFGRALPSMLDAATDDTLKRYHSAFEFSPNQSDYVDDITVYEISGDGWLNDSWTVHEIRQPARDSNQDEAD